ncbi:metallophosphoesterase [Streptomyces sp. APSN-46.1]|uniref:metallophosphoesterase n=1 Tax=Streptomyces sp. APSN-46.1 TaxID=2929049 RepID=UPI001FB309B8|nr:metallophosphoesterase [Streptomyces sp. APSN-46.1]MCJ1678720.1 metallophosphoesterase [Streptomyces sp. APSN-46.1]
MVEGSMTQGAGQGPAMRTETLRDFRVPVTEPAPYAVSAGLDGAAPVYGAYPAYYDEGAAVPPRPDYAPDPEPEEEDPEGYTPTHRDLPIIGRSGPGDTVQVQYVPQDTAAAGPGPLYVVGDVHGYLDELVTELQAQNLIDADHHWSAGNARLWFLGDFTDRGPDGIGVIDLVMRLSAEAAASGGYCKALMGNHELLLIGAKRFGDTPVSSGAGTATFQAAWLLNGGQRTDMERLEDVHLQWMSRLDAAVLEDGHLLLHSDTTAYLDYGDSIEDVNDTVHELLNRNDADITWDLFRKFTKRFAFRDEETGPQAVRELLDTYGGGRVVHGHSPIPYLLGEVGTEDGDEPRGPESVDGPHVYAQGLAIAMDGGVTMAGKLLVVQLPLND